MFQGLAQFTQRSAWHGAVTFILIWLGGISVFSFIALAVIHVFMGIPVLTKPHLIDQLMRPDNMASARVLQIISSIGAFLVPGWIFTKVINKRFSTQMVDNRLLFLALLIPLTALPVVDWLATINGYFTFPIASVDEWMRLKEAQAAEIYSDFLAMNSTEDLMLNLLMMAVIPAVGEEFLFRAGFQQYLGKYLKNHHIAIWVAAFVFSGIHLQFYTFIPRLVMGAGLGYLFHWGGHIGYAVLAHFVNNATAVIMSYLSGTIISEDAFENLGSELSIWVVGSMLTLSVLFLGFRRFSRN